MECRCCLINCSIQGMYCRIWDFSMFLIRIKERIDHLATSSCFLESVPSVAGLLRLW